MSVSPPFSDEHYMRLALTEAAAALDHDDVPVGAVIVHRNTVIGRGHNQRELLADPTAHAEMIALTAAADYLKQWRLDNCTLYVTLEPCTMCAGACVQARLPRLVYATDDPKAGAAGSLYSIQNDPRLNHQIQTTQGPLANEAVELLRAFFAARRRNSQ